MSRRRTIPGGFDKDDELGRKLYVGNLAFSSTQEDIEGLFGAHGVVESVNVITDRDTGRPRGFAFVEMADESSAQKAIQALDGVNFGGRSIRVNEAQDRRNDRRERRF